MFVVVPYILEPEVEGSGGFEENPARNEAYLCFHSTNFHLSSLLFVTCFSFFHFGNFYICLLYQDLS